MKVNGKNYRAVWMEGHNVVVINQPLLPQHFKLLKLKNYRETARAISTMIIRGAGTIGATAGYGLAQACIMGVNPHLAYKTLLSTRPTAADLKHALDRVIQHLDDPVAEAERIADEYVARGATIARAGLPLLKSGCRVLTHCNAGWLALVEWGSATAPIYMAHRKRRKVFVWVDETRPRCQGAHYTSWELMQEGIPHKVIADNAAGFYMRRGEVDLCIVGADRIAANGDTANKIGTYEKAVLAKENGVPFYIAAPSSTFDLNCRTGDAIPIEERDEAEVHYLGRQRVTPRGARAGNPAFDVTPAKYITGYITDRGVLRAGQIRKVFA
jgi:translation initiation factor eIF-2B subunit alpha/methylthioribose-1-phosphate isomerase